MNYDGLLSDEKLRLFQAHNTETIPVEEGAVEEEQVASIQTVQLPRMGHNPINPASSKSETSTPQRKISTSTRFINAFQQLYTNATSSISTDANPNEENESNSSLSTTTTISANRTPTKGMESKLLSMWHNVKYGWSGKLRTSFSKEQPVWLLGRCYHRKFTPPSSMETSTELSGSIGPASAATSPTIPNCGALNSYENQQDTEKDISSSSGLYPLLNPQDIDEIVVPQELGMDAVENQLTEHPWEEGIEGFRRDFYSRIWMTYRREFPTMNGSNYTSDCGWGCMLRSGQMLLAQALICHYLGRSWRYDPETQLHSTYEDSMHKKIIKWFGDSSSKSSPFSIHTLVGLGEKMGKKPGDWYGPASVSYLLKEALKIASLENSDFDNLTIYIAKDCTIFIQDIEEQCRIPEPTLKPHVPWQHNSRKSPDVSRKENKSWKSLIILIPLRLGTEKLNPVYAHCLKLLLSNEYCIGIIGGRPKHSLYFVGFQEDKLIHLDPHYCQDMIDVNQESYPLQSFHCKSPRKLKSSKMDPSCCIGFYLQTKADFDNFVEGVQPYLLPMRCASGTIDKVLTVSQQMPATSNHAGLEFGTPPTQCVEMNYPLFSFSRGRYLGNDTTTNQMSDSYYKPLQNQLEQINNGLTTGQCTNTCELDDDDETEEFVLL